MNKNREDNNSIADYMDIFDNFEEITDVTLKEIPCTLVL